jgi:GH25 family lysozyme M1 (1,4-beta-N-acetylmuramidase)
MTIKIIDLYSGNETTNFDKLALDGYRGVIFKAGQGEWPDVPRVHPTWWKDAQSAGLDRGWYWMVDARHRPSLQIEAMKKATNLDFGELGLWCDCEKPYIYPEIKDADYWKFPYSGFNAIYDFMYGVQQTGASKFADHLPGIYTCPGFWYLIAEKMPLASQQWFAKVPLWTAQYYWHWTEKSKPKIYGAWDKWTLWQYRSEPDINLFNGSEGEYKRVFSTSEVPIPIPVPVPTTKILTCTIQAEVGQVPIITDFKWSREWLI